MAFLYFAPCQRQALADARKEIAYAFDSQGGPSVEVHPGPGDRPGIVFGDAHGWPPDTHARVGYFPDRQTWQQLPKSDLWIGWYELPGPDSLARPKQLRGHLVELADGNAWLIPVARHFVSDDGDFGFVCALPTAAIYDGEQWTTNGPIAKYKHLWQIASQWIATLNPTEDGNGTVEDECDGCVTMLETNYRVGRVECSILGLLTADGRGEIISAVLDVPTFLEWSKKNTVHAGMTT